MNSEQNKDAIELYKHSDNKIEDVKREVANLLQKDLELTLKIDRLTDRIDHGVSVTGQKTLEKVTQLASDIATYTAKFTATDGNHEDRLHSMEEKMDKILTGIFWVAFCGVGGGIVTILFIVIKEVSRIWK